VPRKRTHGSGRSRPRVLQWGAARRSIAGCQIARQERVYVKTSSWISIGSIALGLWACGGGSSYTVGGVVPVSRAPASCCKTTRAITWNLDANRTFAYTDSVKDHDNYSVTVETQGSNPSQTCSVHNGSGTVNGVDVTHVVVTCTKQGDFAFVANQLSNNISVFAMNSTTGVLSEVSGSPFASTGTAPVSLTVHANGKYLYVANNSSDNVSVHSIDAETGALTSQGSAVTTGTSPDSVTFDPTDNCAFVANLASNNLSVLPIDSSTGLLTELVVRRTPLARSHLRSRQIRLATTSMSPISASGSPFHAGAGGLYISISPKGTFARVANEMAGSISAYSINTSSGALTAVSDSPFSTTSSPESAGGAEWGVSVCGKRNQ
jgi:6-phosphogluconolactonase (cycloisomerase 2 family)